MIYLDYAANTPVSTKVLDDFVNVTKQFIANPNSSHGLGRQAKQQIDDCSEYISKIFNCPKEGIIYTSGSSESNNLVIKGIAERNKEYGNHIIISAIEHSSIVAPCNYLTSHGYDVSVIDIHEDGKIDLEELKRTINDKTILVSICYVDGELGTIEPINEIAKIVSEYPHCKFHTDATQAVGKIPVDFSNCDFVTFAPHKFFGLNGFGVLLNMHNDKLTPLIHGGKSTTIYRSGTPVTANVVALNTALKEAIDGLDDRYIYIKELNDYLKDELSKLAFVHINTPQDAMPSTLNISIKDKDAKTIVQRLADKEIYVSTTTACAQGNTPSKSVLAITKDMNLASNSIRISMSKQTTKEELDIFIKELIKEYNNL